MQRFPKIIEKIMKFIDIGANLTDPMFQGIYNGSQKHESDLSYVLDRAWKNGMEKMIITVGRLSEIDEAIKIAKNDDRLYITAGCHPTRCKEFSENPNEYFNSLCDEIERNRKQIVAIGECGLDYDRLKFCDKQTQQIYFEKQLELVERFELPLFLHCRNSFNDFSDILMRNKSKLINGGVVHSFDGTLAEAKSYIDFGLSIGINGCSLKTEENLKTIRDIPLEHIMIETDCPWCSVRPSHAGSKLIKTNFPMAKKKEKWTKDQLIDGRCEPSQIIQVLEIIAAIRNETDIEAIANQIYNNTMKLFFNK